MAALKHNISVLLSRFRIKHSRTVLLILLLVFLFTSAVTVHKVYKDASEQLIVFNYPLNVDMKQVVDDVLDGKDPGIQPVNKLDYKLVIENKNICYSKDGNDVEVLLILVIKSKVNNFDHRAAIRETWGAKDVLTLVPIRIVFLIGTNPGNKEIKEKVLKEQELHQDLVQADFLDAYYNNTVKLLIGLDWATTRCSHSQYIAFLDDDFFVAPQQMITTIQYLHMFHLKDFMLGHVYQKAYPFRNPFNKWYVSEAEYPYAVWPPYMIAGCFMMPMSTAKKLSIASSYTRYLRFDDVYLGIVAYKVGIPLLHLKDIYPYRKKFPGMRSKCDSVIAIHDYEPAELRKLWKEYIEAIREKLERELT